VGLDPKQFLTQHVHLYCLTLRTDVTALKKKKVGLRGTCDRVIEPLHATASFVEADSCSCKVQTADWLQQGHAVRPNAAIAHVHVASIQHADDIALPDPD